MFGGATHTDADLMHFWASNSKKTKASMCRTLDENQPALIPKNYLDYNEKEIAQKMQNALLVGERAPKRSVSVTPNFYILAQQQADADFLHACTHASACVHARPARARRVGSRLRRRSRCNSRDTACIQRYRVHCAQFYPRAYI